MENPIRVLQIFGQMNLGGAEVMIMNIYRKINRRKVQFDFIVHTDKECVFDKEIRELGGRIYTVPKYTLKNHLQYIKAWNRFFDENPFYNVIHSHIRSTASIFLKIAKKRGLVTIVHSHSTSSGRGLAAIARNILQKPLPNISDYLFACSKEAGEWLFGKERKIKIINNAIDCSKYNIDKNSIVQIKKELGLENQKIIIHVGRFNPPKNHTFLIDIFEKIAISSSDAVLVLVGDGELLTEIEAKVESLALTERVKFLGLRRDVPLLLNMADVMLFPSSWEGLPVSLVEAQASALPCVVSDVITDEVMFTNLITKVPLSETTEKWAEIVLATEKRLKPQDTFNQLILRGYDVGTVAKELQEFYISIHK